MEQVFEIMRNILGSGWRIMTGVTIPGLGITAAQFAVGFMVIKWSLNLLGLVTGFRSNAASTSDQMRTSRETYGQYKKVRDQNQRRGGIGFRP